MRLQRVEDMARSVRVYFLKCVMGRRPLNRETGELMPDYDRVHAGGGSGEACRNTDIAAHDRKALVLFCACAGKQA